MSEVPALLRSALAEQESERAASPASEIAASRIVAGDLRIVGPLSHQPTESRIVLVLEVDEPNDFADVLLVHPATELATDRDVVIEPQASSAAYDIVVQTDLRAAIWTFQVGARVGYLDNAALGTVRARGAASSESEVFTRPFEKAGIHSGSRLAGPLDRRWGFKESEGMALRRLAADCTEALLDQGHIWRVHPGLLRPDLLDLADDRDALLEELLHWISTRTLSLTDDDIELLLAAGAFDVEAWNALSDIGADLLLSVQEIVVQVATGVTSSAVQDLRRLLTASHLETVVRTDSMDLTHYLGAKESVS